MDVREDVRRELSYRKENMYMSGRDVLQEATKTMTKNEWERIEAELKRAIR
ncbi:hypothetical protein L0665_07545 [Methanogenium marinum]|uniref:Uncharacterized protein n=1 Tax=Methanogenium marinum TaxID=348610 RepID=A0A9Q4PYR1_9EURY|nr:hypothetical protein [Methanogenium marinum]MDE4908457.1 hypothetical protein [Methanogenium marinum]